MHIDSLKEVEKLSNICERLKKSYAALNSVSFETDHGGASKFNKGYNMYLSKHSDGSGKIVDLSGCYLGVEVVSLVISAIESQFEKVVAELESFGVDCGGFNLED